MTDESRTPCTQRLLQTSQTMATLITGAESEYRGGLDEARAWQRLQSRLSVSDRAALRRRMQPWYWVMAAVAAGFLLGWFGWHGIQSSPTATRATVPSLEPLLNQDTTGTFVRLAAGKSKLPDGTEVVLADGAQAVFRSEKQRSIIEFDRGQLDIAVAHQTAGRPFVVKAQAYEFVVLGTRFSVKIAGPRLELDVTEGRVAVHDAGQTLKVVEGGGHWSNLDDSTDIETPAPSANPAQPELSAKADGPASHSAAPRDPSICRDLSRSGRPKEAEQCYLAVAKGNGLSAEMALYEVARLRRDVLSNPSASLVALDEYESRFASGTLAPEVCMARVDLLARLGRVEEALATSNQLLNTSSGRARTIELHLLRGNLLRDKKHDCNAAIAEYQQIESDPGPRGDQAQFAHARCLEQLGRSAEAVRIYRSYLERSKPQQAERARERLKDL